MNSEKAIRPSRGGWFFACVRLAAVGVATGFLVASCRLAPPESLTELPAANARASDAGRRAVALESGWANRLLCLDAALLTEDRPAERERRRVRLVVDSGAEVSGLLPAVAIGLPSAGDRIAVRALHGGGLDGVVVSAGLMPWAGDFGNAESSSLSPPPRSLLSPRASFVVFPQGTRLPDRVEGLLGADFLMSERIAIDVGRGYLLPSPASPPQAGTGWMKLGLLPGAGDNSALSFLPMSVGRQSLVWLVDCGAESTLLSQAAARRLGLAVSPARRKNELVDVGGGRVAFGKTVLKGAVWGDATLPKLSVGVAPMGNLLELDVVGAAAVDGVLGLDVLQRYDAILDLPERSLWVRLL